MPTTVNQRIKNDASCGHVCPAKTCAFIDVAIIVFYFALVLAIGFYLRGRANTGEDFFMAGREMTAWVAGEATVTQSG
ncbi:MAG: sodium solute transporter superfamily [Acidobacteriaceae bacterium]|nr:sodium solute transporter superfamily [Acidobacteriaceae bacterium]